MKVAIITITEGANYGNRLQNFAMQELLLTLGYEVETIQRHTQRDLKGFRRFKVVIKDIVKACIGKKNTTFNYRNRKEKFDAFNSKYIRFSKYSTENNIAPDSLKHSYDYFICGSDQIWNARFEVVKCDIKNHLAAFADPKQRVAFAASFGTNDIAPGYENLFEKELNKFKSIAVREKAGADIINKLIGKKDVEVVSDPTLLIDKEQWVRIEKKPEYINEDKLLITFFLGGRNQKIQNYINDLASQKNLRVINLENEALNDGDIIDKNVYNTAPDEFIWLIHHADCVLTDSFHASAFSIIFEKPFLVYERIAVEKDNDMSSRIDTLLSKFDLLECRDNIDNPTKIPVKLDYSAVNRQLEIERKKAIDFLKKALED